jgi:MYXO-CTERM domain-containing protein
MSHDRALSITLAVALSAAGTRAFAGTPGIYLESATANIGSTGTYSFNHTIGGGTNRYLLVSVQINSFNGTTVTGVSYNSTALTQIGTETNQANACITQLWGLAQASLPVAGTYSVTVTIPAMGGGVNKATATAMTFANVDQSSLPSTKASATGTNTTPTVDITTKRAEFVVDSVCYRGGSMATTTLTAAADQTQRSNQTGNSATFGVSTEPGVNVDPPGTGTTTMGWTGTSSTGTQNWSISAAVLKPLNATAIQLTELTARPFERGARLFWRTGFELDNLGFHIYREDGPLRVRITDSPIFGSGWLAGPGVALAAGRAYTLDDVWPAGQRRPRYWLEELDLDGQSRMHGPIVVGGPPVPTSREPAPVVKAQSAAPLALEGVAPPYGPAPFLGSGEEHPGQWALAAGAAVKLSVNREGWYEVRQPALLAAGLDPRTDPRRLALFVAGREVPVLISGEEDGVFDPSDSLGFYGQGLNAPATDTRVYWLAAGDRPGRRLERRAGPDPVHGRPAWFMSAVELRPRSLYFAALKNGEDNKFFGPVLGPTAIQQALPVRDLAPGVTESPVLEVGLQGVSFTPHAVTILVDGRELTVAHFEQRAHEIVRVPVTGPLPVDGEIEVAVKTAADTDMVLLDFVRLLHARAFLARDGQLRASAAGGAALRLGGFGAREPVVVLDVTDEERVMALASGPADDQGGFELTVPGSGLRQLLARSTAAPAAVPAIAANHASRWNAPQPGASLVLIGPAALLAQSGPLVQRRQLEGWTVALVDIDDVYDEFSFGTRQVHALRAFAARARQRWAQPPRALLLLGDASFDPRNFLQQASVDLVPTRLVDTAYLETASDDWFTDFDDDGIADIPVGRLPARTSADLAVMIAKTVSAPVFESHQAAALGGPLVFASGADDELNSFTAASAEVRADVPAPLRTVSFGPGPAEPDPAGRLRRLMGENPLLVSYAGHGSQTQWAGDLLSNESVAALEGTGSGAFWISLTCLNAFFQDVYQASLSETLLARPHGGAFGVWASSGLSNMEGQAALGRAFIHHLVAQGLTVGEAAARAKAVTTDRDVRTTWILLGDPTWRLIRADTVGAGAAGPTRGTGMAPANSETPAVDGSSAADGAPPAGPAPAGCRCAAGAAPGGGVSWLTALLVVLALIRTGRRRRG